MLPGQKDFWRPPLTVEDFKSAKGTRRKIKKHKSADAETQLEKEENERALLIALGQLDLFAEVTP